MYRHNDYVKLTKDYLRNYPYYKQAVENMTDDIEEIKVRLADESPKTPSYGLETGGGHSELNATAFFVLRNVQYLAALTIVFILALFGGLLTTIIGYLFFFALTCG